MDSLAEGGDRLLNLALGLQIRLLVSLVIILVIWLLRLLMIRITNRRTVDIGARYRWRKLSAYVAAAVSLALLAALWLEGGQSLATYAGLLSAGVAIALREPMTNLAGWAFILWRRPFRVGDRVQIGDHAGDVVDQRIFQFTLLEIRNWVAADQSTGRVLHVPNGRVFTDVVANYSSDFDYIWNEIPVLITFESDWEKAQSLLEKIANEHAAHLSQEVAERLRQAVPRFMIVYSVLTPAVYLRVQSSGVLLTIRYLCEPRGRRSSEHAIWQAILRALAADRDIEFAYPTQRFYYRQGLSQWRAEPAGAADMHHGVDMPCEGRSPRACAESE